METPVEIDFQGMQSTPRLQASIEEHVAKLEQRYGRVTACRVVVKAPGAHHRTGLYEINIRLALPDGREVNVARTPQADERYADLPFAVNDTFRRARRRLQDHVRRMQGQVKQHDGQPIGTVIKIDSSGEFGFLESTDVLDPGFAHLSVGARVSFAEEMGEKGVQASTVRLLGKHSLRA